MITTTWRIRWMPVSGSALTAAGSGGPTPWESVSPQAAAMRANTAATEAKRGTDLRICPPLVRQRVFGSSLAGLRLPLGDAEGAARERHRGAAQWPRWVTPRGLWLQNRIGHSSTSRYVAKGRPRQLLTCGWGAGGRGLPLKS